MRVRENQTIQPITLRANNLKICLPPNLVAAYYSTYFAEAYPFSLINESDVVLDLGAGFGDFTLIASEKVGPEGKVVAVEPNPTAFSFLKRNIQLNHAENVSLIRGAVTGSLISPTFLKSDGDASALSADGDILVKVLLFESVVPTGVDVIKMDIEGTEKSIFDSSMKIIQECRCLFVETHTEEIRQGILHQLQSVGFQVSEWNTRKLFTRSLRNVIHHIGEFAEAEIKSRGYGLRAVSSMFHGVNSCNPRSGLRLLIPTQ